MKLRLFSWLTVASFFIISSDLVAQVPSGYQCTIRNDSLLDARIYEFDIYLQNTDAVNIFELATFQAGILVNSSIVNGGTITPTIVSGSSELVLAQRPISISFASNCIRLAPRGGPGLGGGTIIPRTSPGIRVARIRLTNTVDFGQARPDFAFNYTATPYNTVVGAYDQTTALNVNITNPSFHSAASMFNPVLNGTLNLYNVTGGGATPAAVGLDGSQADGVRYILYNQDDNVITTSDGTGSAITFGNQTTGTYDARAHRVATYMYSDMTGTAAVYSALIVTPTANPSTLCAGESTQLSAGASGGSGSYSYAWSSNPAGFTSGLANPTVSPTVSTTYTVLVNDGYSSEASGVSVTVNPLPAAAGTITGTASVCQGQSGVAYSVPAISGATSYSWAYTGTGATITGTTNSVTIAFATNATTGNLTVRGVNTCGNGTVSANYAITVNPLPGAAGTITGTASVCQGQSGVAYSVPAISGATSYSWAYTGTGATITGTTNAVTIAFATNATSGNLTVRGVNTCGNGTISANYPITVNTLPSTSAITGNATPVCSSTGNVYSVTATAGSSYAWTVPTGSTITAGGGTNSITVTFGTTNGNVSVTETNSGGCTGTARTLAISLQGCGLDADFTGTPLTVCAGSTVTFTNTSTGTTGSTCYSWNFGSGATPATANTAGPHNVTYSTGGTKTVSLTITEGAVNTETKTDYITVNPLPGAAGTITGTASVCQGQSGVAYSVPAISGATSYSWAYTGTGATITGTTNAVTIAFATNATSGNLTVRGVNTCGNGTVSANYGITVNPLPGAAGTITGTASVCQGQSGVAYSVPVISGATSYSWAYTGTGATITGTTNAVTIAFATNATSGNLTVRGVNTCGNGTISANYPITVNTLPSTSAITGNATPVCSSTGNVYSVTATAGSSYAWTVPTGSTITAGGGTNSITVTFGTNNGNVSVTETNSGGCAGTARTLAISLQGCGLDADFTGTPLTVCAGSTVTFTNTSTGTTGSTAYSWNFGSGATPATANTVGPHSVTYSTGGTKTVSLTITEGAVNTETKTDYITVNPLPAAAGTITGTASVCQGQSGVAYSVPAISGATSYSWAYTGTGATITGTTNAVTIAFATNATSGNLTVRGVNTCGNGTISANYPITVNTLPSTSAITGNATPVCSSTGNVYSVTATAGSSYAWTVPAGSTITAGSGTNSITVRFGTTNGNITVTETNSSGCQGTTRTLFITLQGCGLDANFTATPLTVCAGSPVLFANTSLGTSGSTTFQWSFGSGATPSDATGAGPHTVTYSTGGLKTVSLTITDGAVNTETKADYITVNPLPGAAGTITGSASVCQGQSGVAYSVPAITGAASYNWTYSGTGATITGTTNAVTIAFASNATSGNLTVRGVNSCGNGTLSAGLSITVNTPPSAPVAGTVTQPTCSLATGSVTLSGLPLTGTWTLTRNPGGIVATSTGASYTVTGIPVGTYTFTVTNSNGCTSPASAPVVINTQPAVPTVPIVGTVTQPTCAVTTGSVGFSGLPSTGVWTLTRLPAGDESTGSGTTTTLAGIPSGSWTFTVTNASGCTSAATGTVTINAPLPVPAAPVQTVDCTLGFNQAVVTVTSPTGTGYEYRLDAGATRQADNPI